MEVTPEATSSSKKSTSKCIATSSSGSCPFHNWFYIFIAIFCLSYAIYLGDKESFKEKASLLYMGPVHTMFQFIDTYSPFNEFLETDEELIARLKTKEERSHINERVFTKSELAEYTGKPGSPGLYLAFLGVVYDVSKGKQYYGDGGGYGFFAAKDASRAFVTGQFDEAGLIPDVSGLSPGDYLGLEEWQQFYQKDYIRKGVLDGEFFTSTGQPTSKWTDLQKWITAARERKDEDDVEKKMFPPCNVEWTQTEGSRYWCTKKSGGVNRIWVGVPRQLYYPGSEPRCACIRSTGSPSTDPSDTRSDRGDLDSPHVKVYPGCDEDSFECKQKGD